MSYVHHRVAQTESRTLASFRASPVSNRISATALRVCVVWSGKLESNQRPPGSRPGALTRLSYSQESGNRGTATLNRSDARGLPRGSSVNLRRAWSTRSESNTRPHAYQACALPTELLVSGNPGEIRTRTSRLRASRPALSRPDHSLAGRMGLEPTSPGSTVQRSRC